MNATVATETQFKSVINQILQDCLKEIGKETAEYLKIYVNVLWYQDHYPDLYNRTYRLLESITSSEVKSKQTGFEVSIFFDTSKIIPNFLGNGLWNEHMGFNGAPFTQGLVETIEKGNPSPYSPDYARDGIGMFEETAKWLEKELPRIAKKIFAKYGILIYVK